MNQPTKLRILGNLVLLIPLPADDKSPGGILFPARYTNPQVSAQYRVVDTGPGRRLRDGTVLPPEVQRGEYCLILNNSEHITFDNGAKLVDVEQVIAKWGEPEN
jgi:co-chaperonin GroES (HSP10)